VIGKSVATVKVSFIARIGLISHFGDRPFLAAMVVTLRGCCGGCCWRLCRGNEDGILSNPVSIERTFSVRTATVARLRNEILRKLSRPCRALSWPGSWQLGGWRGWWGHTAAMWRDSLKGQQVQQSREGDHAADCTIVDCPVSHGLVAIWWPAIMDAICWCRRSFPSRWTTVFSLSLRLVAAGLLDLLHGNPHHL
jgi:hypothetical protein